MPAHLGLDQNKIFFVLILIPIWDQTEAGDSSDESFGLDQHHHTHVPSSEKSFPFFVHCQQKMELFESLSDWALIYWLPARCCCRSFCMIIMRELQNNPIGINQL